MISLKSLKKIVFRILYEDVKKRKIRACFALHN